MESQRVAQLSYPGSLHDARVAELSNHVLRRKLVWQLGRVGLDAANKVWASAVHLANQLQQGVLMKTTTSNKAIR